MENEPLSKTCKRKWTLRHMRRQSSVPALPVADFITDALATEVPTLSQRVTAVKCTG